MRPPPTLYPTISTVGAVAPTLQIRESKVVGQESVSTSTTASGNISSGMEISKSSVFSPVLSSTIMQGPEAQVRLPHSSYSNTHRPTFASNLKQHTCHDALYNAIGEEYDDRDNNKSASDMSVIEKV